MEEIYVLVTERDVSDPLDPRGRAIVFGQYIDNGAASLESVKAFQSRIGDSYGKSRIARLHFLDEEGG